MVYQGYRIISGSDDASYAVNFLCGIHIVNVSFYGEGGQHGGDVALLSSRVGIHWCRR